MRGEEWAEICTKSVLPGLMGKIEEDMTSLVTAQVLQRHRLLGEGVCMIEFGRD